MSNNNFVYPDWVQKHRVRGNTIKRKGDNFYLYRRTSKRVPGKKYLPGRLQKTRTDSVRSAELMYHRKYSMQF